MPQTDQAAPNPHFPTIPSYRSQQGETAATPVNYYASSTFNTCEHQALPLMDSPPMRLMIDPNACHPHCTPLTYTSTPPLARCRQSRSRQRRETGGP